MACIVTESGRVFTLSTNFEVAKFILISYPKMKDDPVVGSLPQFTVDDEVKRLLGIRAQLHENKIAKIQEDLKNGVYDDTLPF